MLDLAWTEYLLIAVVALVLLGPKELPVVLGTLGRWVRQLRHMANSFQDQLYSLDSPESEKQADPWVCDEGGAGIATSPARQFILPYHDPFLPWLGVPAPLPERCP
ncbi:MAG: Sec-independent protein translocase protein TatB [Alphaproteobacteria bacterium]|nr:Sec-independent protein translocase protein TatB [Alphaproteobacteria bacterium]